MYRKLSSVYQWNQHNFSALQMNQSQYLNKINDKYNIDTLLPSTQALKNSRVRRPYSFVK